MTPHVRLIAKTVPVISGLDSTESLVAYCAKVSSSAQDDLSQSGKLLNYLRDHSHWSPLEMAHVVFEIVTSRAIARQLLRHRSFSFQEFSQRYSDEIEFQPLQAARLQDKKNRQSSIEHDDETLQVWWEREQDMAIRESETRYIEALSLGIAKECARVVLPEGLTTSRLYMAGSLRSWFHYCELRTGNGTQLEHQEIALAIQDILVEEFPSIFISQKKGTM